MLHEDLSHKTFYARKRGRRLSDLESTNIGVSVVVLILYLPLK